jgi:hypothetical protein
VSSTQRRTAASPDDEACNAEMSFTSTVTLLTYATL